MVVISRHSDQHVVSNCYCRGDLAAVLLLHPADKVDPVLVFLHLVELVPLRAEQELPALLGMLEMCWNRKIHLPVSTENLIRRK